MSTTFQYRKKPVVVEAFQWTATFVKDMEGTGTICCPQWLMTAMVNSQIKPSTLNPTMNRILTKEGWMDLPYQHWVIRGIQGEIYSCDPEIFAGTYEKVAP